MYQQMLKIRLFEEQVNELYTGAKMPGLAHLYIGEEAIAVGVCEALPRTDARYECAHSLFAGIGRPDDSERAAGF